MSNLVYSKSTFGKGGIMPAMEFALAKVKFVGIGQPWKSGAPTAIIQDESGTQYRIGVEAAIPVIKQQCASLLVDKGKDVELIPNVEFMFSAAGFKMTFSKVDAAKPETAVEKKAREKAQAGK